MKERPLENSGATRQIAEIDDFLSSSLPSSLCVCKLQKPTHAQHQRGSCWKQDWTLPAFPAARQQAKRVSTGNALPPPWHIRSMAAVARKQAPCVCVDCRFFAALPPRYLHHTPSHATGGGGCSRARAVPIPMHLFPVKEPVRARVRAWKLFVWGGAIPGIHIFQPPKHGGGKCFPRLGVLVLGACCVAQCVHTGPLRLVGRGVCVQNDRILISYQIERSKR